MASYRYAIRARFLQHDHGMRRLAWGLVVTGLVIGLAGEFLVIVQHELLHRELLVAPSDISGKLAEDNRSLWQAVGIGTAIAAFGLLLLVVRPLYARLFRRRIFAELVSGTREGSSSTDDSTRPGY